MFFRLSAAMDSDKVNNNASLILLIGSEIYRDLRDFTRTRIRLNDIFSSPPKNKKTKKKRLFGHIFYPSINTFDSSLYSKSCVIP